MLSFLKSKRKRLTEQCVSLIANLLDLLPEEYDKLRARQGLWEVCDALYFPNSGNETVIMVQAHAKHGVSEGEVNRKSQCYELSGITVPHRKTGQALEIILPIWHNSISNIHFPAEVVDFLAYDVSGISIEGLKSKKLEYVNEDTKKVKAILKGCEAHFTKLELDDTFEIETTSGTYFTIVDMEDGNYIAIDKKKRVFRLYHNAVEPEKVINRKIEEFLLEYSGKKEDLQSHFV